MTGEILVLAYVSIDITRDEKFPLSELSLKAHRDVMERALIIERLKAYSGNISQVVRSLEIDRTNLHKKIKYLSIANILSFNELGYASLGRPFSTLRINRSVNRFLANLFGEDLISC